MGFVVPERRAQVRQESQAVVACRIPATPEYSMIENISQTGCRVKFLTGKPELGATIILTLLPGVEATGQILWVQKKVAGVRFVRAIGKGTLATIAGTTGQGDDENRSEDAA